jgi:hypothetical protein
METSGLPPKQSTPQHMPLILCRYTFKNYAIRTLFSWTFGWAGDLNLHKRDGIGSVGNGSFAFWRTAKLKNPACANNKTNIELWRLIGNEAEQG